jgi:2'-5' RNA ligase
MPLPIRAFIGIELDERLKRELARLIKRFSSPDDGIKWVDPGNIHITLKFLEETPVDKINAVERIMDGIAEGHPTFHIDISGLGAFPNKLQPRILWVGISKRAGMIETMASELDTKLQALGFPPEEHPFSPHITLGRVKGDKLTDHSLALLNSITTPSGLSQKIERIALVRSTLTPKGPEYDVLKYASLSR